MDQLEKRHRKKTLDQPSAQVPKEKEIPEKELSSLLNNQNKVNKANLPIAMQYR